MLFHRLLASTLFLLSGSAAAFHITPSSGVETKQIPTATNKNLAKVFAAGVISAATFLLPLAGPAVRPAVAAEGLDTQLAQFGAASYPVFNSITDVSPLADEFVAFINQKVKAPDAEAVIQKAVDGLLAIPDSKIQDYSEILKKEVYRGVSKGSCVSLGGSGTAAKTLSATEAVKSVPPSKIEALKKKFEPANAAVPIKDGNICLPGTASASEKLWVAQADLTLSMPKAEASALVSSIKKVGKQATRSSITTLVPNAEKVFSKSEEAIKMLNAGKQVEPAVIQTVEKALK